MIDARELALNRIRALTGRYQEVDRSGAARRYNEAQTVNDFILPLFEALGWDIHNRTTRNEVLPEQAATTGRADWTFSVRGIPKMLVEAKRISADLGNPDFARQAITYSYSRGVTWAVLTNFRELKVYNSEWALSDPDLSRFLTFTPDQFETDFDRLWLLSRSSIEAGLLDAEAERYGKKRTKSPVGEQLFSDLVRFRYQMRRTFLAYNPSIPAPEARIASAAARSRSSIDVIDIGDRLDGVGIPLGRPGAPPSPWRAGISQGNGPIGRPFGRAPPAPIRGQIRGHASANRGGYGLRGASLSVKWWSRHSDLNRGPAVYETAALPLSYVGADPE